MTFAEMKTAVLSQLGIGATSARVTQVEHYINQERGRIAVRYELDINEDNLAVTGDDPVVSLPADFAAIRELSYNGTTLAEIRPHQLARYAAARALAPGAVDGPLYFHFEGVNTIRIEPPFTDTAADSGLILRYVARPALLTGTNSPSELPAEYHQALVEYAVYRIAAGEGEINMAASARDEYDRILARLQEHISLRKGGHDVPIRRRYYG